MFGIEPEKYLKNKGIELSEDMQKIILNRVEHLYAQSQEESYFDRRIHRWIFGATHGRLLEFKKELEEASIFLEYNWVGHRGEWFFPSYEDALAEEDWCFQCAD